MAKITGMPAFVKKGAQYMNVIKAIEDYSYYHKITGQSMDKWEKWRTEEVEKWHLDKSILWKEVAADGEADYERPGCHGSAGLRRDRCIFFGQGYCCIGSRRVL